MGAAGLTDGAVLWLACSTEEAYRHLIGANDDIVLVEEGSPSGRHTIALDAADGTERWRRSTAIANIPRGPFDGQGVVVLSTDDGGDVALVGVDVSSGQERWRIETANAVLGNSATTVVVRSEAGPSGPARVQGIDRATGAQLWVSDIAFDDQSGVGVARSPASVLGEVITVPTGTTVTALDMGTGAALWTAPQLDHPEAADGIIVGMPAFASSVAALDASSGEPRWTAQGRPSYGELLPVGDGVVVVRDSNGPGDFVAYELESGNERWRVPQVTRSEPQLIEGTALVMLWEGDLSVLSTADGATTWSATEPFLSPLMNNVTTNGSALFVAINSLPWSD